MAPKEWYKQKSEEVLEHFQIDEKGLSHERAIQLLKEHGLNALPEKEPDSLVKIFIRQFKSPLIYILLIAAVIVFLMSEYIDALIIMSVLIVNAVIGTLQEGKAQDTLAALKKFTETEATVVRDGRELIITDKNVVPGDIIALKEGDKIPADARIIFANNLRIDEAALTGESEPVLKTAEVLPGEKLETPEQKNMVFKGTYVVNGEGRAVVVATGLKTVIGAISSELKALDTEMPLKANIAALSKIIIWIVLGISVFTFFIGIAYGNSVRQMFATVVAIAVSAIPEGLPVVVTLILATGVWRMGKRNALVKKLQAVEALGQSKVIALDKTGTITKNQMMVTRLFADSKNYEVTGDGYEPKGEVKIGERTVDINEEENLRLTARTIALVAEAATAYSDEKQQWERISGDPTDAALLTFAAKLGFEKRALTEQYSMIDEIPFASAIRYHATLNRIENKNVVSMLAAPEILLDEKHYYLQDGERKKFNRYTLQIFKDKMEEMSHNGLRVLAIGLNTDGSEALSTQKLPEITLVGLIGMRDVIRTEAYASIEQAKRAGIQVVMITGDYEVTARAIAREAHIYNRGDKVLTGNKIEDLSVEDLASELSGVTVFARVTPEHKLKIIEAYRKRGEVIAMTGDGVNDALSLVSADLGVAMGRTGTEVAKEASDIVLLDDNFSSIVAAIEEGRNIYRTIKKVIFYLFSTGVGEIFTIIAAILLALPVPLTPGQIIWLNLVTDGFLVVALAFEPKERGILFGHFTKPSKWIGDRRTLFRIILTGSVMMFGSLFIFIQYWQNDLVLASTMVMTYLAVVQWLNAYNAKSATLSIAQSGIFKNKWLLAGTVVVILLQIMALYTPFFQKVLQTKPLTLNQWLMVTVLAFSVILVEEVRKSFSHRVKFPSNTTSIILPPKIR